MYVCSIVAMRTSKPVWCSTAPRPSRWRRWSAGRPWPARTSPELGWRLRKKSELPRRSGRYHVHTYLLTSIQYLLLFLGLGWHRQVALCCSSKGPSEGQRRRRCPGRKEEEEGRKIEGRCGFQKLYSFVYSKKTRTYVRADGFAFVNKWLEARFTVAVSACKYLIIIEYLFLINEAFHF